MSTDIHTIREWLEQVRSRADEIRELAQSTGVQSYFTISATAKNREGGDPYVTPIRKIIHGYLAGAVVSSQTEAILACRQVDGVVDHVLVDAEKTLSIAFGPQADLLEAFGLTIPPLKGNARVHVELGNLSSACSGHIARSRLHQYKPNDLTVEAAWHFLTAMLGLLSGRKIAIVGAGNIGFKLALKLVESGVHVELVRRDLARGTMMADVINLIKPRSTLAAAHYNADHLHASLFCDAVVGCTAGTPVITWQMIQCMKPSGIVLDVGKGSIHPDAMQQAAAGEIPLYRCDVSSAIDGLISTLERNDMIISGAIGRRELHAGVHVVSGGYLGLPGDVVVDNYMSPTRIIGIADGKGDLRPPSGDDDENRLTNVMKHLGHEED